MTKIALATGFMTLLIAGAAQAAPPTKNQVQLKGLSASLNAAIFSPCGFVSFDIVAVPTGGSSGRRCA
jgi:hypothetical protein